MMPVAAVACQSRSLDAEHSAHAATAYFGNEALKSRALNQAGSRASKIVINYDYLLKAHLTGLIREAKLTALALLVMNELGRRGLANVDDGPTTQAIRSEFRVHRNLRFLE